MPERKKRPSADKTRKSILKAAQNLFAQHGFNGSSISKIAKKANINQSLIYHHFENKEDLWREVKTNFLREIFNPETLSELDHIEDPKQYLAEHCQVRYAFLSKNPEALRIITWQMLEPDQTQLTLMTRPVMKNFTHGIQQLQEKGQIKDSITPELIHLMMNQLIRGILNHPAFHSYSEQKKQTLLKQGIELLTDGLLVTS